MSHTAVPVHPELNNLLLSQFPVHWEAEVSYLSAEAQRDTLRHQACLWEGEKIKPVMLDLA